MQRVVAALQERPRPLWRVLAPVVEHLGQHRIVGMESDADTAGDGSLHAPAFDSRRWMQHTLSRLVGTLEFAGADGTMRANPDANPLAARAVRVIPPPVALARTAW